MDLRQLLTTQWDRVAAGVCTVIGALALLLGWLGISDTAFTAEQIPYLISGGIASIFFLGLAGSLWLSADLRDEWRKLDSIDQSLRALQATTVVEAVEASASAPPADKPAPSRRRTTTRSTAASASPRKSKVTATVRATPPVRKPRKPLAAASVSER
jgi:hypothetical protein